MYLAIVLGGREIRAPDMILQGYSDTDYASCRYIYKSTSGYVFFMAGVAISHQVKRQSTIALSSTESEYYSIAKASQEATWLCQLLLELGYDNADTRKVLLYSDNQGSLAVAENPESYQRTKHVAVKYYYITEQHTKGLIDL
jgi:hypothetical protein